MNKKAIVFTFIVIILLSIIIISFLININNRTQNKIQTSNIKVETLNGFVRNLNSTYFPDALRSSSNQVIISLLDYDSNQSNYLIEPDFTRYIKEVIETGKFNNINQEDMFKGSLSYTLPTTINEIRELGKEQGIVFEFINYDINSLQVTQEDPWHVKVSLIFNYKIKDSKNEYVWDIQNRRIYTLLNVESYRDPLYLIESSFGKISVNVKKTKITDFSSTINFNDHIDNIYFRNNNQAPSFLKRLKRDLTADINGVESLLDPDFYSNIQGYSNADYQFLNNVQGSCVNQMPSNFRLDLSHISYYQRTAVTC